MKVKLKRDFFYAGRRWRHRNGVLEMPEDARDALPSDAEVVEDEPKAEPKAASPKVTPKAKSNDGDD